MKFLTENGRLVFRNIENFRVDWDSKSRSKAQFKVKQFFKKYWHHHVVYEEMPVFGTRLKVDIANVTLKIAVEVNGQQHENYNKFFHGGSRQKYFNSYKNDMKKRHWLEINQFEIVEIYDHEADFLTEEFILDKFNIRL